MRVHFGYPGLGELQLFGAIVYCVKKASSLFPSPLPLPLPVIVLVHEDTVLYIQLIHIQAPKRLHMASPNKIRFLARGFSSSEQRFVRAESSSTGDPQTNFRDLWPKVYPAPCINFLAVGWVRANRPANEEILNTKG